MALILREFSILCLTSSLFPFSHEFLMLSVFIFSAFSILFTFWVIEKACVPITTEELLGR